MVTLSQEKNDLALALAAVSCVYLRYIQMIFEHMLKGMRYSLTEICLVIEILVSLMCTK